MRIRIDSLNIELPVINHWDYDTLKIAPSRYQGSYYDHNLIIAEHNYQSHFGPLLYLNEGTIIEFINAEGQVYQYQGMDILELDPKEISILVEDE